MHFRFTELYILQTTYTYLKQTIVNSKAHASKYINIRSGNNTDFT